jgi:two-component system, chemotaxis family, sensor kinase CheA
MSEDLAAVFREELADLVESLEHGLLDLRANPEDPDVVNQVFRDLHTIKGSGAMFGFAALAGFIHDFENAFDRVRSGKVRVTADLIRLGLAARDEIAGLAAGTPDPQDRRGEILRALQALTTPTDVDPVPDARSRLTFRLMGPALALGARPDLVLTELTELGATDIQCEIGAQPPLAELDADVCHFVWTMSLPERVTRAEIEEVFLFVEADWTLEPASVPAPGSVPAPHEGSPAEADVAGPHSDTRTEATPPASLAPVAVATSGMAAAHVSDTTATVRVPAARLDTLMDSVGELVTVEARLTELVRNSRDSALIATAELITRLAGQLRDATIVMRMVPMRSLIARFRRLIHSLSESLGKPVAFVVVGEETELDKTMIEKLADPLVHILRNALDHGMETAQERQAAGKSGEGRIELSAIHAGGEVLIRVRDDGRGMNVDRIRAKAVERGLIAPDAQLTDSQIFALIFEPGFSTAEVVTELSGRGVGMDVVRRTIEGMRGSIDVDSRPGYGTSVTLRLPLTLAIIDGLLIEVADEKYTLPLASVQEIIELSPDKADPSRTGDFLDIRGKFVPFLRLRRLFDCASPAPERQSVVIVEAADGCVGLVVDHIIGTNQTVIKQMSKLHRGARSISGATILGDGTVALIIDVPQLVAMARPVSDSLKEIAA